VRVVAMFRVSTETQASEGTSLDAQERIYREMAAKSGWTTVAEFRGCESATQAAVDRRVLQQALACIREQAPDAIYVHEQSRLTRGDELEVAMLMRELKERRIKIIVNGVVRDLGSIDERFMIGIQSLVDRAESERIKERMGRGKREKARQGKKNSGPAPYGYRNPLKGTPGHGTLEIVPEEAIAIRRIFEMFAAGKGKLTVAKELNNLGIPAPRGGKWGGTTIVRTIQNLAYIGVQASNVWVVEKGSRTFRFQPHNKNAVLVENAHPPIIDRALWDAVHGRPKPPRTAHPRMLSEMLYVDGRRFGGDSGHGQTFYCDAARKTGCARLDTPATDNRVWDAFASLATAPEFVEKLLREAQNPHQQQVAAAEVEWLEDSIGKTERKLARLVDMRAEGEIDKATFAAKASEARESIERMRTELGEQRAKAAVLDGTQAARIVKAVQTLLAGRTRLTVEQKRQIMRSIVRRVDITTAKAAVRYKRDEMGHVLPGAVPQWEITSVAFQLTTHTLAGQGAINRVAADRHTSLIRVHVGCTSLSG
jgi:DNA invertase Pin-like site-specific DNA recombinase